EGLGGHVKKGAKSIQVVFWKMFDRTNTMGKNEKIPMLRYYKVFNVSDIEGLDLAKLPQLRSRSRFHTCSGLRKPDE
ncbi:MAG: ArdC family protein, partial [Draconibacterium sp.]|nr:ArdC family protein [Draconibacterium sp.]